MVTHNRIVDRLVQAQAHAEAQPLPTSLRIWRNGVDVEMWDRGRRITRRVSWNEIEQARMNAVLMAIDDCSSELAQAQP